jgi:adenylate kinase
MIRGIFLVLIFSFANSVLCIKNFVLISAPGSGKGTFSQYLVEKHGYIQICPGDIFRREIRAQTELGKKIQPMVDRGDYVDEDIVCKLISDHVAEIVEHKKGFIIDGFPRSEASFNFLHKYLGEKKLDKDVLFVQLTASDETCAQRIEGRVVCSGCSMVYNVFLVSPKKENKCDKCYAELSRRKADSSDVVEKRLVYFHRNIQPLLAMANKFYEVREINTEKPLEELKAEYDDLLS